jgi:hypothetical protein
MKVAECAKHRRYFTVNWRVDNEARSLERNSLKSGWRSRIAISPQRHKSLQLSHRLNAKSKNMGLIWKKSEIDMNFMTGYLDISISSILENLSKF